MRFEGVGCPLETRAVAMKLSMALGLEMDGVSCSRRRESEYQAFYTWYQHQLMLREWGRLGWSPIPAVTRGHWRRTFQVAEVKEQKRHDPRAWVNMNQYNSKGWRRIK